MTDELNSPSGSRHAVVIGGGIAGLLTAAVLSAHAERVTVVDRDRVPQHPEPRPGVPQGQHTHVLLEGGQVALERLLPGMLEELRAAGLPEVGMPSDVVQWQAGRWFRRGDATTRLFTGRRPHLEQLVRRRVLRDSRIRVVEGTEVVGLTGDVRRVRGVLLRKRGRRRGGTRPLDADLVVDASGRSSRAADWLRAVGAEPPREERIDTGLVYATRLYRGGAGARLSDCLGYFVVPAPDQTRGGVIMPVEGDGLHLVTLSGLRDDAPPTDAEGFEAFAGALPHAVLSPWLAAAQPVGPVRGFGGTANVRRRYDRPGRRPAGFLAVGDALCTFNPVYGQGMTVAALGAVALREALEERRRVPTTLRVQRAVAVAAAQAWDISAGSDKDMPGATGNAMGRPAAERPVAWYLNRVQQRSAGDAVVGRAFRSVLSLAAPVGTLFTPAVLRAVLFGRVARTPDRPPLWSEAPGGPQAASRRSGLSWRSSQRR
jgi:2-polyprenyl-6-methoxyphenol hydroxylase-like FAD-dependent oxidoreductase